MKDLRIVFMGTPEFAVPSLEILVRNNYQVVGVITAPDKPKGRGQKLTTSPVKDFAVANNLNVLQPTNLKSPEFQQELKDLRADVQVVVAFRMLPEAVWSMPPLGTFNLHASLLPDYRGAAPIHWAVINGEEVTGVTTFFLQHEIDTGNIIFQEKEAISPDDTTGTLYERLMNKGAGLVLKTIEAIASNAYTTTPQQVIEHPKLAPKIFKETCEINWSQSSTAIVNFVRGLNPVPTAWTTLRDKQFKIFAVSLTNEPNTADAPGTIKTDQKNYVAVKTNDGWVSINEWQPEGKKRMSVADYFRGNEL